MYYNKFATTYSYAEQVCCTSRNPYEASVPLFAAHASRRHFNVKAL